MKFLILGAGPTGLTFANKLKLSGEDSFVILEKEKEAGGLCRSYVVDGAPLDIGGGHFLDTKRPEVNNFLFQFMPEDEWNIFNRDSRIQIKENLVSHPLEANIWQMDIESQVQYLKSISVAKSNVGEEMPKHFVDWIYWKLGKKIADDYMIPYNEKMFGKELDQLGTYWLEKLPNVSFEETLLSCLQKKAFGSQPGHARFYYPKKYGYGELWSRMAINIGDHIEYKKKIKKMDLNNKKVYTFDGNCYQADCIITTIPWAEFQEIKGLPIEIVKDIKKLKSSSIQIEYVPENMNSCAHWIYYPNLELSYHRILIRHNFCPNSKGYWTETNGERVRETNKQYCYNNKYAYPLNTIEKPQIMKKVIEYCASKNVYAVGRWGEHQHYNSDVAVEAAINCCKKIICK